MVKQLKSLTETFNAFGGIGREVNGLGSVVTGCTIITTLTSHFLYAEAEITCQSYTSPLHCAFWTSGHWLGMAGHSFLFGVDYLHLTPYIAVEPQEIAGHLGSDAHNGFRGEWSHEIDRNDG